MKDEWKSYIVSEGKIKRIYIKWMEDQMVTQPAKLRLNGYLAIKARLKFIQTVKDRSKGYLARECKIKNYPAYEGKIKRLSNHCKQN